MTAMLQKVQPRADAPTAWAQPAAIPLLQRDDHAEPSVLTPETLLRVSRRQKRLGDLTVPRICLLDPDGDVADYVRDRHQAERSPAWACYHTDLWSCPGQPEGALLDIGIVARAVGSSFAVLVAEQLFASGCELLISLTSAGEIVPLGPRPHFVLIERALRDEGTSYHYLPPAPSVEADPALLATVETAMRGSGHRMVRGTSWTTDAPYRETERMVALRRAQGAVTVEMEAAALYAFAQARAKPVVCLAYVTNQLGGHAEDFEKGEENGARAALELVCRVAAARLGAGRCAGPDFPL